MYIVYYLKQQQIQDIRLSILEISMTLALDLVMVFEYTCTYTRQVEVLFKACQYTFIIKQFKHLLAVHHD